MLGLKRGTVELVPHQKEWDESAEKVIAILKDILSENAVDIQHVGSTAIPSIKAKPIVDIAVGMRDLNTAALFDEKLKAQGIIFRGEERPEQRLYVMGDFENDTRTHHIHFVEWKGKAWKNYLAFRDYLNANPSKARLYENCKIQLVEKYKNDRIKYTNGKQELIDRLLEEANRNIMHLRPYTKSDAEIICSWIKTEEELYKWSADRFNKFPLTGDDMEANYAPQLEAGNFYPLTAVDDDGNLLGHFIIRYPNAEDKTSVRFGFLIVNPDFRGKGYGKQMLLQGLDFAKKELKVRSVDLGVFENNDSARHYYERKSLYFI